MDEEQAIPIREADATAHLPLQNDHLASECHVLCLKFVVWQAALNQGGAVCPRVGCWRRGSTFRIEGPAVDAAGN